ncbi:MAG: UvrD-helicase domain-containing protein [Myxococcota bacterium]|nr:UvrD-helicase domain-containing protein [Myxococcota bacterium]
MAEALPLLLESEELQKGVVAAGPLRMSASADGGLLCLWNTDYLSAAGDEGWGFIRAAGQFGLLASPEVTVEVLERQLYVIAQRLQGLLLNPDYIHRAHDDGVHSCLAGRGTESRPFRVAYCESEVDIGGARIKSLISAGPHRQSPRFLAQAARDGRRLDTLVQLADGLLLSAGQRPIVENDLFMGLRDRFSSDYATTSSSRNGIAFGNAPLLESTPADAKKYETLQWTYEEWLGSRSPLSVAQRRILMSDGIQHQPLRIIGAAGTGKTLLMMLLAIRRLRKAEEEDKPLRVAYIAHNSAMRDKANERLRVLGAERYLSKEADRHLYVSTLLSHSRDVLEVQEQMVVDSDALETKAFQFNVVLESLAEALKVHEMELQGSDLLSQVSQDSTLLHAFAEAISDEISLAIKGQGFGVDDRQQYVESERRLSRVHGQLSQQERHVVFSTYKLYNEKMFDEYEVFDSDDLAISMAGRLNTPLWEMKRRKLGFDYVFVDEAQLFNENERRLFPLLTRGRMKHVPLVMALDEAQQTRAAASGGLARLGIRDVHSETLADVHRSTPSILRLAFFVIQRTTDLFGSDFPDFTGSTTSQVADDHKLAAPPQVSCASREGVSGLATSVADVVEKLRRQNLRQIAVVCHSGGAWEAVLAEFRSRKIEVVELSRRGERLDIQAPYIAVARPATVGGQEFDAVVCVGLEQGVVPPRVQGNVALAIALEQQALREMYVSFTRARFRLMIVNAAGSTPTRVLAEAAAADLLSNEELEVQAVQ